MERQLKDLTEFQEEARAYARALTPRAEKATLVLLAGELGAGKTTFVKEIAKTFGITDVVNSPTFVLEKIYPVPTTGSSSGFTQLIHIDAYRLTAPSEIHPLKLEILLSDTHNLILLEWPERVPVSLLKDAKVVMLRTLGDSTSEGRTIAYA